MSYNIPNEVIEEFMGSLKTVLEENGYVVETENVTHSYGYQQLSIHDIRLSFKQSFGEWRNNNYGWLSIEYFPHIKKKIKVKFQYPKEYSVDKTAIKADDIDTKKLLNRIAAVVDRAKEHLASLDRQKKYHDRIQTEVKAMFPVADIYTSTAYVKVGDNEAKITPSGDDYKASIQLIIYGTLEELKVAIESLGELQNKEC